MAKAIVVLIVAICLLVLCNSCGQAGSVTTVISQSPSPSGSPSPSTNSSLTPNPSPTIATVTSGGIFLPGEVLAGLPVYPGAIPTTWLNPDSGLPSYPESIPFYGDKRPGYQMASAQYTVQATADDILSWYANELAKDGYRKYLEGSGGSEGTINVSSMTFSHPSQPLVTVEVHVYTAFYVPVIELLVVYSVPLPKPPEEMLPEDIDKIKVTYFSNSTKAAKTIIDSQTIVKLVDMVNNLPVCPDYFRSGGPTDCTQTIFNLVFHSLSKGDITVTDVSGCAATGIYIGDYPILEDRYGVFRENVEKILGVPSN